MPAAPVRARPSRLPAILFDLDGTLIDSIELILRSARFAFEKLGRVAPSDEEWLTGVGIPLFTMMGRYASTDAECAALIAGYREFQVEHHDRLIRCYDGVVDVVTSLHRKGHPLAIVTSKTESLALRGLTHVGLARYMDTIVGCDATSRHKPDPEPVQIALQRLGCLPESAVFVGDSVHDVLAGNAAGVRTIAATWGAFKREDLEPGKPNAFVSHIADLLSLVAGD